MILNTKYKILNTVSGFTIIELLVAIGIFLIVTAVTLANFPSFSNRLSLNLLAEDVTLSIKQAQVFGSSVYGVKISAGKTFDAVGVHFEAPLLPQTSGEKILDYHYVFYADLNKDYKYNSNVRANDRNALPRGDNLKASGISCELPILGEECLEKYIVNGANKVLALCPNYTSGGTTIEGRIASCKDPANAVNSVDITFVRASLEANFSITKKLGDTPYSSAENIGIILGVPSASGSTPSGSFQKAVVIWRTGLTSFE